MLHPTMPPPTMTTRVRVGRWEFTLGPDLTRQHFFHNALIRGVTHRALGGRIRPVSFSVYRVPSDAGEHSFAARANLLFTPGPLTTSLAVKTTMLHDAGSWHFEFNAKVQWVRDQSLRVAGLSREDGWDAILLQGSGTFGIEAVFATCVPSNGKVCVLANGAYGERMALMLQRLRIDHVILRTVENTPIDPAELDRTLAADRSITHVAAVHC